MTALKLTDTRTKTLREISPSNPDGILRMYHCGPTVYGTPHLGNIRRFLVADLLVRTARFLGYRVRSVMNITDVGHLLSDVREGETRDRVIVTAEREGKTPEQIAAKYTAEFFAALAAVRADPADYYPRATMHIPQMQNITRRLVEQRHAYETASGVYFDVTTWPDYGKLSGNTPEAIRTGARVDVREDKRHPADFALWIKAPKEHAVQWDSPWGRGYPGWHIECSAMSMQLLGETLDVHTGGNDNIFPHHENEIAQSEASTGKPFVHTWVHNEFLELADPSISSGREQKMAKSGGNVLTLNDLTARGDEPLAFRLLVLQTHYRSKLRFSWETLDAAAKAFRSLRELVQRLRQESGAWKQDTTDQPEVRNSLRELEKRFTESVADDLGSPQALAALFDFTKAVNPRVQDQALSQGDREAIRTTLRKLDTVLALLDVDEPPPSPEIPLQVQQLMAERAEARRRQDFAAADRIRNEIHRHGYEIEDTPRGPRVTKKAS